MTSSFLIVTRREVRETVTDWRLLIPMLTLSFLFPSIMVAGMNAGLPYLDRVDPTLAGQKAALFGAAMAAFFPISFSLIVALESFAGEKERNTLEALLASPVSDTDLFVGKFLAVLLPPAALSLVGLGVFTVGARLVMDMEVPPGALLLAVALGFVEALVMVAAAVVVSSQAPTVKAANILASFIIIPVALVVQAEVLLLLTGYGHVLWFIVAEFVLISVVLLRMGIRLFNREEILTREHDQLNPRAVASGALRLWRQLPGSKGSETPRAATIGRLYLLDFPRLLRVYRGPLTLILAALAAGALVGYGMALAYPLDLTAGGNEPLLSAVQLESLPGSISAGSIFLHNLRVVVVAAILSLFSFGVAGILVVVLTTGSVAFLASQASFAGVEMPRFLLAFIAPHGIIEIPALALAGALNLWLGMSLMTLPRDRTLGEGLLMALVNWAKGALVFVPLLLLAAIVESHVTPRVILALYGG